MGETPERQTPEREIMLRRLRMRSWRRGMKEMDLILGPFADAEAAGLNPDALDAYERMLTENDQDLFRWVTGGEAPPDEYAALVARLLDFHHRR